MNDSPDPALPEQLKILGRYLVDSGQSKETVLRLSNRGLYYNDIGHVILDKEDAVAPQYTGINPSYTSLLIASMREYSETPDKDKFGTPYHYNIGAAIPKLEKAIEVINTVLADNGIHDRVTLQHLRESEQLPQGIKSLEFPKAAVSTKDQETSSQINLGRYALVNIAPLVTHPDLLPQVNEALARTVGRTRPLKAGWFDRAEKDLYRTALSSDDDYNQFSRNIARQLGVSHAVERKPRSR